jgi:hypothetical protein
MRFGGKMPSVTQVLSKFSDWTMVDGDVLSAAQQRGQIVHAHCAAYALGQWTPTIQPEYQGYFDSFQRWFDAMVQTVILVEKRLMHPTWNYDGQPDLVCTFKGDERIILIDLKTPQTKHIAWPVQMSAYSELIIVSENIFSNRVGSLRLSDDGKSAKFEEYTQNLCEYFNIFLSCLNVYNYFYKEIKNGL